MPIKYVSFIFFSHTPGRFKLVQTQLDYPTFMKHEISLTSGYESLTATKSLQKFKGSMRNSIIAKSIYASLIGFILEAAKTDSLNLFLSVNFRKLIRRGMNQVGGKEVHSNVENIQKFQ